MVRSFGCAALVSGFLFCAASPAEAGFRFQASGVFDIVGFEFDLGGPLEGLSPGGSFSLEFEADGFTKIMGRGGEDNGDSRFYSAEVQSISVALGFALTSGGPPVSLVGPSTDVSVSCRLSTTAISGTGLGTR